MAKRKKEYSPWDAKAPCTHNDDRIMAAVKANFKFCPWCGKKLPRTPTERKGCRE